MLVLSAKRLGSVVLVMGVLCAAGVAFAGRGLCVRRVDVREAVKDLASDGRASFEIMGPDCEDSPDLDDGSVRVKLRLRYHDQGRVRNARGPKERTRRREAERRLSWRRDGEVLTLNTTSRRHMFMSSRNQYATFLLEVTVERVHSGGAAGADASVHVVEDTTCASRVKLGSVYQRRALRLRKGKHRVTVDKLDGNYGTFDTRGFYSGPDYTGSFRWRAGTGGAHQRLRMVLDDGGGRYVSELELVNTCGAMSGSSGLLLRAEAGMPFVGVAAGLQHDTPGGRIQFTLDYDCEHDLDAAACLSHVVTGELRGGPRFNSISLFPSVAGGAQWYSHKDRRWFVSPRLVLVPTGSPLQFSGGIYGTLDDDDKLRWSGIFAIELTGVLGG